MQAGELGVGDTFSKVTVPDTSPDAALTTASSVTGWFETADGVETVRIVWLTGVVWLTGTCDSVACVDTLGSEASVAVIVTGPGVVELLIVAE